MRLWWLALPLSAQNWQTWHQQDLRWELHPRVEVTLHTQLRTAPVFRNLRQGRTGPIVRLRLSPVWSALAGYYARQDEVDDRDAPLRTHRLFAGAEATLPRGFVSRTLFEQFWIPGAPNFQRYRQRLRWTRGLKLGPALSTELYFNNGGWLASRNFAGLRWRPHASWTFESGYVFEQRRAAAGGRRQVLLTLVEYRLPPLRRGP
jgi:hypothetical protein